MFISHFNARILHFVRFVSFVVLPSFDSLILLYESLVQIDARLERKLTVYFDTKFDSIIKHNQNIS